MLTQMSSLMLTGILLCWFFIYPEVAKGAKGILVNGSTSPWYLKSYQFGGSGVVWAVKDGTINMESSESDHIDTLFVTEVLKYRSPAKRIYVDIKAYLEQCYNVPCKLEIYAYYARNLKFPDSDAAARKDYFLKTFSGVDNVTVTLNKTEDKTFSLNHSGPNVTFGVRARAASWTIYQMKMYYYYCEKTIINNVQLPSMNSSEVGSKSIAVWCSPNSTPSKNVTEITATCLRNGTWKVNDGIHCSCLEGFQKEKSKGCLRCPKNFYRSNTSAANCTKCPNNRTNNSTNTGCDCIDNHYSLKDMAPCYGLPSNVLDVRVNYTSGTSVNVTWREPEDNGGIQSVRYDVECYRNSTESSECEHAEYSPGHSNISTTFVTVSNLRTCTTYVFKVYSKNAISYLAGKDKWNFTESRKWKHEAACLRKNSNSLVIILSIGAAILVLIIVLVVIVVVSRSRRQKARHILDQQNNLGFEGMTLPTLGQKMYIDPSNYDDPEVALKDFVNEVNPKSLVLERVLGGGEFGDVYKGKLTNSDGKEILVAAKTLKHDSSEKNRKDFFMEASAMGQFHDPNVIHLEGVITKTIPHMIITEYMSNGSLDHFLKQNDEKLTDLQMIGMARGVASGMKYLAAMHFVHRDLAARNVLISETMVCKIADFGLSRELETADSSCGEYCTSGGKIPVRWTAPEAINYRKFSSASDVWSYGIVLWEIMSFGDRPYWDWDNFKVLERVNEGFRLPAPKNCPKSVHELMLKCWEQERSQRPQFPDIVVVIDEWIRSPEKIRNEKLQFRNSLPSQMLKEPSTPIKDWLDEIRMSSYMPHFTSAGYKELSDLAGLLDDDLKSMGISLVGHRNKMLRTIRSLPVTGEKQWKSSKSLRV